MKKIFRKFHLYASIFFLPMALLFSLTGILYICGINQDYRLQKQEFIIASPHQVQNFQDFILSFLEKNNLLIPKDTQVKPDRRRGGLIMGSAKYFITVKQQENHIVLATNKRSFIGNMIMLHKARVAQPFVAFSIIFGIALLLFYFSGFMMITSCNQVQKISLFYLFVGILTTIAIAYISL